MLVHVRGRKAFNIVRNQVGHSIPKVSKFTKRNNHLIEIACITVPTLRVRTAGAATHSDDYASGIKLNGPARESDGLLLLMLSTLLGNSSHSFAYSIDKTWKLLDLAVQKKSLMQCLPESNIIILYYTTQRRYF
mmetsp:Transcript_23335/g.47481  ORF Transcript_23335/g.47481 Transcript_23335/m.47481 type:complete len:134 (+) Transcript_23335:88-489(+)